MRKKTAILAAVIVLTAVCGMWLLRAPSREQQAIITTQEALMQDILSGISENSIIPLVYYHEALPDVSYNTTEVESDTYNDHVEAGLPDAELLTTAPDEYEALYEPDYGEYEAFYFEPLSDTAFPSVIQGIGILTVERINLRLPIAEGVEYATLRIAPGRVSQTAQVGEIGNAVIAGHRNYTFGSMFSRLGELELGDVVGFQARNGEEMLFTVFEIAVIEPHDQIAFIQPVNDSIITLYTCTPIRTATHRLIIRAQRIY